MGTEKDHARTLTNVRHRTFAHERWLIVRLLIVTFTFLAPTPFTYPPSYYPLLLKAYTRSMQYVGGYITRLFATQAVREQKK